jgi:uncharacterized protein (TIGR03000 family)
MDRTLNLLRAGFIGLALVAAVSLAAGQPPDAAKKSDTAKKRIILIVKVPADAQIEVDGAPTKATGEVRKFKSPELDVGKDYSYTIKATWTRNGKPIVVERKVAVRAGEETEVDLRKELAAQDTGPAKKDEKAEAKKDEKAEAKKEEKAGDKPDREPDVIFVPTPQEVVDKMLELAEVKKDDIVYDLGCGDGRIPITAAKKYGCKAWGFDIDPARIKDSLENVKKNMVENLVTIEKKDIFTLDLSKANVITLYLLPELNVKLIPQLEKLKPGSRIVSHDFDMEGVKPKKVIEVETKDGSKKPVYLWTVPLEKEKKAEEKKEKP